MASFMTHSFQTIILAAGASRRMMSKTSKIFHPVAGLEVVGHVLKRVQALKSERVIVVSSPLTQDHSIFQNAHVVVQKDPLGTAHAVQTALPLYDDHLDVLILCGDTPNITTKTLETLLKHPADLVLIGMTLDEDALTQPYGRIVCDENGAPRAIVEYKDGTEEQRKIPYANAGAYKIKASLLKKYLPQIKNDNASSEYYLTDLVSLVHQNGHSTAYLKGSLDEWNGVNTRHDLAKSEQYMQNVYRDQALSAGVTLMDPRTTYFSHDTQLAADVMVSPQVSFGPGVRIEEDVRILPFCHLENVHIGKGAVVGPFAHIRGHCVLGEKVQVGNFVELKAATLDEGAKVKHLSYMGDAHLEARVNIGAGTITCNYDGKNKHKTHIQKGAHIGANVSLVAPITIGESAVIGAGSVVTKDVPNGALSLERSPQIIRENYKKALS